MTQKKNIIDLLEKLIAENASFSEKEQLFRYVNNETNQEKVLEWLKENWDNIKYDDISLSSKKLLDRIHQDISRNETNNHFVERKSKVRRIAVNIMKYAAVCVVACGIEWYVITQMNQDVPTEKVLVSESYNEINVPSGSKSFIVLADSTKVWLNAGAKLRYPSNFQESSRNVYLEGEAFFDVAKNKEKPFYVGVTGMNIKVLGTKFNVKAYADEQSIETTLLEGAIEVVGLKSDQKGEDNLKLTPGQKLVLFKDTQNHTISRFDNKLAKGEDAIIKPIKIEQAKVLTLIDTEPEISWKEDRLIFNKERFEDVKIKLERWYGVTIEIKDPDILDYRFTGVFENETFEQALLALKQAADFNYQIKKKQVFITSK